MGKKGGSAPKAPDPIKVAAGQTAANIGNEIAKQGMNINQVTRNVGEQENDAWNQLMLTGRSQALNELLTERNQPLNEISALLSGGAVNQPNFTGTPTPNMQAVDYAGLMQNKYNADMAAYQQKQADKSAALGGMFSALGTAVAMSDRRVKKDIEKVGKTDDGQNIYAYRYKSGGPLRLGLIAQEVEQKKPGAVVTGPDGLKRVDYRKALRLGERASQEERLVPTPRPHPFRDPAKFSYSKELASMAKASGVPGYDQLAFMMEPGTLSRLANLQTAFGKPFNIYGAYAPKGHAASSEHKLGKAFDINLSTSIPERARLIELATQMGFKGTGTYDKNVPGVANAGVHVDVGRQRSWGGYTKKTGSLPTPEWHKAAIRRGLTAGEPDMEAVAAEVAAGYPIFDRSGLRRR